MGEASYGPGDVDSIWVFNHSMPTDITSLENAQVLKLNISVSAAR